MSTLTKTRISWQSCSFFLPSTNIYTISEGKSEKEKTDWRPSWWDTVSWCSYPPHLLVLPSALTAATTDDSLPFIIYKNCIHYITKNNITLNREEKRKPLRSRVTHENKEERLECAFRTQGGMSTDIIISNCRTILISGAPPLIHPTSRKVGLTPLCDILMPIVQRALMIHAES